MRITRSRWWGTAAALVVIFAIGGIAGSTRGRRNGGRYCRWSGPRPRLRLSGAPSAALTSGDIPEHSRKSAPDRPESVLCDRSAVDAESWDWSLRIFDHVDVHASDFSE